MITARDITLAITTHAAADARTGFGVGTVAVADMNHRSGLRAEPKYLPRNGKRRLSRPQPQSGRELPAGSVGGPADRLWATLVVQRALCS